MLDLTKICIAICASINAARTLEHRRPVAFLLQPAVYPDSRCGKEMHISSAESLRSPGNQA
jgi:hypothetical protein